MKSEGGEPIENFLKNFVTEVWVEVGQKSIDFSWSSKNELGVLTWPNIFILLTFTIYK